MGKIKTAESVCLGHPDKLCDFIADMVVRYALMVDKNARTAVEVMAVGRRIIVAGEISCKGRVRVKEAVQVALDAAGYNYRRFWIRNLVRRQSPDIAQAVEESYETRNGDTDVLSRLGAGDQGTVYGYATRETKGLMPLPLVAAHDICAGLEQGLYQKTILGIGPDGKAQVSVEYNDEGKPARIDTVVVSIQHSKTKDIEELRREVRELVLDPVFEKLGYPLDEDAVVLINPSGRFIKGGPEADTGLTGRKLMVDTYGGLAPHGGGAFAGKDGSKVDRSGAYMARLCAKTLVDACLASEATVGISYAIGKAYPVAVSVDTNGSGQYPDEVLASAIVRTFDLRPAAIIDQLKLKDEWVYRYAVPYHHFGFSIGEWEASFRHVKKLTEEVANANRAETSN